MIGQSMIWKNVRAVFRTDHARATTESASTIMLISSRFRRGANRRMAVAESAANHVRLG
jgi:hypothetical protein